MTATRPWARAAALTVPAGRRPELPALSPRALPSVEELFTFMRDAESRFSTLRLRIEQVSSTVNGETLTVVEVVLRHPGEARVTTSEPALGLTAGYEVWITDGETVRTYVARHRLGTQRPIRGRVAGLGDPDLPGFAKVYEPITPLPIETLAGTFVHPAGFCQNVLATGSCTVVGTAEVAGREAIVLACDHPRTTELPGDRPDYRIEIAVDRETGVICRLVESIGASVTRRAEAAVLQPDAPLPPSAFDFAFPPNTTFIY